MHGNDSILKLEKLSIGFSQKGGNSLLLKELALEVKRGELVGLIGRNGSGKSSLLRTLVRLQNSIEGSVFFNSFKIQDIHPQKFAKEIAFVPSGLEYNETMTVRELVSLGRFPYTNWIGNLNRNDLRIIQSALDKVGIQELADRKLTEISDGEKQKASIARTLAQDTPLIILDEPTAYLDLPAKNDIVSLLHELVNQGKTVIFSTHDLNIAIRFSDKLWLISENTILQGSPEDLILNASIAGIFESDRLRLNPMSGDFELRRKALKTISLTCTQKDVEHWTREALKRRGYEVVRNENPEIKLVVTKTEDKIIWNIQRFNESLPFESIYEMLQALP
ncbi:MAG: ABC transporter ATP-binding protein [Bacteroidales bacterium]|nr:ABC transporter ATP-binding protein [Bacteroidales bacterium]MCB9013614.1 ABC transporter ATP-binding protein [Bacteroidales bacterium]